MKTTALLVSLILITLMLGCAKAVKSPAPATNKEEAKEEFTHETKPQPPYLYSATECVVYISAGVEREQKAEYTMQGNYGPSIVAHKRLEGDDCNKLLNSVNAAMNKEPLGYLIGEFSLYLFVVSFEQDGQRVEVMIPRGSQYIDFYINDQFIWKMWKKDSFEDDLLPLLRSHFPEIIEQEKANRN